jgi:hypothetical protein
VPDVRTAQPAHGKGSSHHLVRVGNAQDLPFGDHPPLGARQIPLAVEEFAQKTEHPDQGAGGRAEPPIQGVSRFIGRSDDQAFPHRHNRIRFPVPMRQVHPVFSCKPVHPQHDQRLFQ